jgi:hypothetical protein
MNNELTKIINLGIVLTGSGGLLEEGSTIKDSFECMLIYDGIRPVF